MELPLSWPTNSHMAWPAYERGFDNGGACLVRTERGVIVVELIEQQTIVWDGYGHVTNKGARYSDNQAPVGGLDVKIPVGLENGGPWLSRPLCADASESRRVSDHSGG
jgi:hypothetical protein